MKDGNGYSTRINGILRTVMEGTRQTDKISAGFPGMSRAQRSRRHGAPTMRGQLKDSSDVDLFATENHRGLRRRAEPE